MMSFRNRCQKSSRLWSQAEDASCGPHNDGSSSQARIDKNIQTVSQISTHKPLLVQQLLVYLECKFCKDVPVPPVLLLLCCGQIIGCESGFESCNNSCPLCLASFPGPTQLFIACSTEKRREPGMFPHYVIHKWPKLSERESKVLHIFNCSTLGVYDSCPPPPH